MGSQPMKIGVTSTSTVAVSPLIRICVLTQMPPDTARSDPTNHLDLKRLRKVFLGGIEADLARKYAFCLSNLIENRNVYIKYKKEHWYHNGANSRGESKMRLPENLLEQKMH